jgi:hypothetical protein
MKIRLLRNTIIDYSSASALEYFNDVLYVVGDDVNFILCLDEAWNKVGEIKLFDFDGKRMPKPDKPDLESACFIDKQLFILGSGSKSPQRDIAFSVAFPDKSVKRMSTGAFFSLFRDRGLVTEMNIEGFTRCRDKLLLFNRANNMQPNQLIITDQKIIKNQFPDRFKVMSISSKSIGEIPLGISGATYDERNDILFLTASAENTDNAYDDGVVVGSAIAIIRDAYQKLEQYELLIDEWMILEDIDSLFKAQKIESICIVRQDAMQYHCILAADNDNGSSGLFEVEIIA